MALTDWTELAVITAEISRLQVSRQAANAAADLKLLQAISDDLVRTTSNRDALLARIDYQIGAGAPIDAPGPQSSA